MASIQRFEIISTATNRYKIYVNGTATDLELTFDATIAELRDDLKATRSFKELRDVFDSKYNVNLNEMYAELILEKLRDEGWVFGDPEKEFIEKTVEEFIETH